MQAFMIY